MDILEAMQRSNVDSQVEATVEEMMTAFLNLAHYVLSLPPWPDRGCDVAALQAEAKRVRAKLEA